MSHQPDRTPTRFATTDDYIEILGELVTLTTPTLTGDFIDPRGIQNAKLKLSQARMAESNASEWLTHQLP